MSTRTTRRLIGWLALVCYWIEPAPAHGDTAYPYPPLRGCMTEGDPCDTWYNMTYTEGRCVRRAGPTNQQPGLDCVALALLENARKPEQKPSAEKTTTPGKTTAGAGENRPEQLKTQPGKRSRSCSTASGSGGTGALWLALAIALGARRRGQAIGTRSRRRQLSPHRQMGRSRLRSS